MEAEIRTNDLLPRNTVMLASPGLIALTNIYIRGNEIVVEGEVDTRKVAVCRINPETAPSGGDDD